MNTDTFWKIIEEVNNACGGEMEIKPDILTKRLKSMDANEVLSFSNIFESMMNRAYTWDLWAAAYIIHGGCSDDAFMDFRSSLISMGKDVFERTLSSPETLADMDSDDAGSLCSEGFAYPAISVYKEKTGKLPEPESSPPADPAGEKWDEDESVLKVKYPRLWNKFGESPVDGEEPPEQTSKPWWRFW
jgi:hypothetical protein